MSFEIISLNGEWTLRQPEHALEIAIEVPGDAHTALLAQGIIADPSYGMNLRKIQWVGEVDWLFSRSFEVTTEILRREQVFLLFDGIDTHGTISLNGVELGRTNNAFKPYRFDARAVLREGKNDLHVFIRSGHQVGLELAEELPYEMFQGRMRHSPQINAQRKPQFQGGWDWCHCQLMHGIPGDVRLLGSDSPLLNGCVTSQEHSGGSCRLSVTANIESFTEGSTEISFEFDGEEQTVCAALEHGMNAISCHFEIRNPQLWWPAGYGEQPLYDLKVSLGDQSICKRIGLRSIELVREADEAGESFGFRVNGTDIFASGANWIPADDRYGEQTADRYRRLLHDFHAGGMNMLRIWGGGQYEPDVFYETCDELGILVWHDLMFACMPYPGDPDFLANIEEEVRFQVARLRDHPCIVLWCGGNELLGSGTMRQNMEKNPNLYMAAYTRLIDTLKKAVTETDPTRAFWPTSPCRGEEDFTGYWYDDTRGDTHFWDVGTGGRRGSAQPFTAYQNIRPRFCSEFGMLSYSALRTLNDFCPADQLTLNSEVLQYHAQRSEMERGVVNLMFHQFRIYPEFEYIHYLSQLQQAMGIKYAVEFWRSTRVDAGTTSRARCRGALYWQYNDVWPASIGWSSVDHHGRWKQLHYQARRFASPALMAASISEETGDCVIYVSNETGHRLQGTAMFEVLDIHGCVQTCHTEEVDLANGFVLVIKEVPVTRLSDRPAQSYIRMKLRGGAAGKPVECENFSLLRPAFELPVYNPNVRAAVRFEAGSMRVDLQSGKAAFYVMVESKEFEGYFSDNALFLSPGVMQSLEFIPREKMEVSPRAFEESLSVFYLR